MMRLLIVFVLAYIVLSTAVIGAIVYFLNIPEPSTITDWKDLASIIGVPLTLIASLMAVLGTLINAKKQIVAQRDIETLKNSLQNKTEELKSSLQRQIEVLKIIIPQELGAYRDLYSAAVNYYRTLATLENGEWNNQRTESAEEIMTKAEANLVFLQVEEHKALWTNIRQDARNIADKAKLGQTPDAWKQVWREEARTFGEHLKQFEDVAKSARVSHLTSDQQAQAAA